MTSCRTSPLTLYGIRSGVFDVLMLDDATRTCSGITSSRSRVSPPISTSALLTCAPNRFVSGSSCPATSLRGPGVKR